MGTYWDVRGALDLEQGALAEWLSLRVETRGPWPAAPVAELIASLAQGGAPINGHLVGTLPVRIDGGKVRWSWRRIASEVAPEILVVSRAMWRAGASLATRGVHTQADALGGHCDAALLALHGMITDVTPLLPMIGELMADDPQAITPDVDCCEDIPF